MSEYLRPGVYIEEASNLGTTVVGVPTAVPAFVGYTEKAADKNGKDLFMVPTPIRSMLEYTQIFGKSNARINVNIGNNGTFDAADIAPALLSHRMYYNLQLYFANGGGIAWIVAVGSYPVTGQQVDKAKLLEGLAALDRAPEVTLLSFPDIANIGPKTIPNTAQANRFEVLTTALAHCAMRNDRFLVIDQCDADADFRTLIGTKDLAFGAVYTPDLQSALPWQLTDSQIGFIAKSGVTEEGALALDKNTLAAVRDGLQTNAKVQAITTPQWLANLRTMIAALPSPVLQPSGAVLGVYATTDANQGVWRAPANVALNAISAPVIAINDTTQSELNVPSDGSGKSINAIRQFAGRGTLVWGARTLDGNSNDWRYIQVRRTIIYIEQSLKNALLQMVFEPNDAATWAKVRSMTEAFLGNVWREGGLAGAKPDDAFTVQCGLGTSMTNDDILNGKLVVNIALAVTRPAEYIFITLTQSIAS